jgi:anti-anti-sigma factor
VLGIDVVRCDDVPVARPLQDIDAGSARRVHAELSAVLEEGTDKLVLDLSATEYVDSAGIDMLFRLSERLRQRRSQLVVVIPESSPLMRIAAIVDLASAVPVCETVQDALDV